MASNTKLSAAGTKFVKFRGNLNNGTAFPTDDLDDGEMFYRTSDNKLYTYISGAWRAGGAQTSTSTSSTTTSTTTS